MLFRSVRFKIILLYMALLTLTLTVFTVALYKKLKTDLYRNVDNLLQTRAEGIEDSIDTYWEVEKLQVKKSPSKPDTLKKREVINFAAIARLWVNEESNAPELLNIIVQIFDAKGNSIASSKNMPESYAFSREFFTTALQGRSRFDTATVSFSEGMELSVRVLTMPVFPEQDIMYIVQVASPLDSIQGALDDFKEILFVLLPLAVFITGIIGVFLAKITLNPVDRIIKTVQKITAESLKLRIQMPGTRDEIERLAATFNDMLDRLEKAFSSQKHFIQDASHELKTPLTILQGELEVTLKRIRTAAEYEEVLKSSLEEIRRISSIVENLLLLARVENRETGLDVREFNLQRVLQEAVNGMEILAREKSLALNLSPDGAVMIRGDEQKLKQVFLNLLDNAIKYTPPHGSVSMSASITADSVRITVQDTGIGIPPAELPHIFDRFYRVDKARSSRGFGLGLSIARSIVEAHRGTISAESSLNRGSTFIVLLPATALPVA
jgi:heavy metal sensor kinase